jgi:hypothetical protein
MEIEEVRRYIGQAASGRFQNLFLSGDRGIGKSSLGAYLKGLAVSDKNLLGIHVYLGKATSLEEMVRLVFDGLLREARTQGWFDAVKDLFGKHITAIDIFNVSVTFRPPQEHLSQLVMAFPEALTNLISKLRETRNGLFIVLDNINGLADSIQFANWYKDLVDEIAKYDQFPVLMMVIGLPEQRALLAHNQQSLMRVFRIVEVGRLSNEEVTEFLKKAYTSAGVGVEEEVLQFMASFSSGLPALMQEIGDATFWVDSDGTIEEDDAVAGLQSAAEHVGRKYVQPIVYEKVRSAKYRSILRKLPQGLRQEFSKKDIESKLSASERKVLSNFLTTFKRLGIIESDRDKGRGEYRFVNAMFAAYFWLESLRLQEKP